MNDSQSIVSSTPSLSTLPPELLNEILTQKSLSKADLARCCLVSKRLLHTSRPKLYSTIKCDFLDTPMMNRLEIDTFKFLRTLRVSPTAKYLVNVFTFDMIEEYQPDCWDETVAEAVEVISFDEIIVEMLDLAPQVTRLALSRVRPGKVLQYIHSKRARWTELDIPDLAIDFGSPTSEGTFNNLRKVSCSLISSPGRDNLILLPPYLERLGFDLSQPGLVTIENAFTSPLRFIRLELQWLVHLPDLTKLPHLQHLYLDSTMPTENPSTAVDILNRLGGLVSLSLCYYRSPGFGSTPAGVSTLLSCLSLPLHRLDFEESAPLVDLASLIKSDRFKTLRTLGLSKRRLDYNDFLKQDLIALSEVCQVKGIVIVIALSEVCQVKGIVIEKIHATIFLFDV